MRGLVTIFGGSGSWAARWFAPGEERPSDPGGGAPAVAAYRLRLLGDVGQIEIVQANIRNPASVDRALSGPRPASTPSGCSTKPGGRSSRACM